MTWKGLTLVDWPQNEHWIGRILGGDPTEAACHLR